ncbi:MAG: tRNA dimethylallyltransferase [Firmicutes bacterium]|nr:tRNA dimethylallyltransferase [Bacillota bacterium]
MLTMEQVIAIIGPTAVGKTKVGIDLAKHLSTEIISGDSMLIYRGMNIGTAKPDIAERSGIRHHLIDIRGANDEYCVVDFQKMAGELIYRINSQQHIPILVGGTGLYVKSLLEGFKFSPIAGSDQLRNRLTELVKVHGNEYLHNMLAKVEPVVAARLHPNDQRRIIRALEIHFTGEDVPNEAKSSELIYDAVVIGLTMDRQKLYDRINQRVDLMIRSGLVEEVDALLKTGVSPGAQSMQGIGYKEIVLYLQGKVELPAAIDKIKQATRNFAKRQLTWYRKMPYTCWVDVDNYKNHATLMEYIYNHIAGKFNRE